MTDAVPALNVLVVLDKWGCFFLVSDKRSLDPQDCRLHHIFGLDSSFSGRFLDSVTRRNEGFFCFGCCLCRFFLD